MRQAALALKRRNKTYFVLWVRLGRQNARQIIVHGQPVFTCEGRDVETKCRPQLSNRNKKPVPVLLKIDSLRARLIYKAPASPAHFLDGLCKPLAWLPSLELLSEIGAHLLGRFKAVNRIMRMLPSWAKKQSSVL